MDEYKQEIGIMPTEIEIEFRRFFKQDLEDYVSHLSTAKKLEIYGLRDLLDRDNIEFGKEEIENYTVYRLRIGLLDGCDYQRVSAYYSNLSESIEAFGIETYCDYPRDPILFLLSNEYSRDIDSRCVVIDVS